MRAIVVAAVQLEVEVAHVAAVVVHVAVEVDLTEAVVVLQEAEVRVRLLLLVRKKGKLSKYYRNSIFRPISVSQWQCCVETKSQWNAKKPKS